MLCKITGDMFRPGARVGLLGGSFNPAHEGHRHISLTALKALNLHQIWWLVSPQNPLKDSAETQALSARLDRARDIARYPKIVVTDLEARLGTRYTADTVKLLRTRYPHIHFVWLMGADNFIQLPRWYKWTELMSTVPVAIVARPGYDISSLLGHAACRYRKDRISVEHASRLATSPPPAWTFIFAKLHPASSTELRDSDATEIRVQR